MQFSYLLLCAFIYFPVEISGARILAMFAYPGKSHWDFYRPLLVALADRGHNVTVVGYHPEDPPIPGYTDITLSGLKNVENSINIRDTVERRKRSRLLKYQDFYETNICEAVYEMEEIQQLAKSTDEYDLLITELFSGECFVPFAHKFDVPVIALSSTVPLPFIADYINLPDNPSYIPSYNSPFDIYMTFKERLSNTLNLLEYKLGYHFISRRITDQLARRLFPDMPPLIEMSNNISLIISNTHFSITGAKPSVPALVEAGGMHITEPKGLPYELEKTLNESEHGVVYVSLGTLAKSETLPPGALVTFIHAFSTLNQTVLWKMDVDRDDIQVDNLTPNIILVPWVAQMDVLCHPKVKVFITNGGMLSSQESVFCGVPMIALPLFGDQFLNVIHFVAQGFAVPLDVRDVTLSSVEYALEEILGHQMYTWNARRASIKFQERPRVPIYEAIFWTEYVIRFGGAPLQTSARNLNWIEYLLFDVLAALCLLFCVIVFLGYWFVKLVKVILEKNYVIININIFKRDIFDGKLIK